MSCPVLLFLLIPTNFDRAQRVEGQTCLLSRLRKTNSMAKSNFMGVAIVFSATQMTVRTLQAKESRQAVERSNQR